VAGLEPVGGAEGALTPTHSGHFTASDHGTAGTGGAGGQPEVGTH